jgi:hypothetical protein
VSDARLAANVISLLSRRGFDATLQQASQQTGSDFDVGNPTWSDLATVKAVWDNPRTQWKGLNDSAPASVFQRRMTIAYRDDIKSTDKAVGLRVVVNGTAHNVISVAEIGEKVGLRLMLEEGTEA